jgi:hypothetical protein
MPFYHREEELFMPVRDDDLIKGRGIPFNVFNAADVEATYIGKNFGRLISFSCFGGD